MYLGEIGVEQNVIDNFLIEKLGLAQYLDSCY